MKKKISEKDGKTIWLINESIGNFSEIQIKEEVEIKKLIESLDEKANKLVSNLMKEANTAVIRIIRAGWSKNKNYYSGKVLESLPAMIQAQGPLQFMNHLMEGSQYDRNYQELVSYTKYVWYDKTTEAVYAVVRFPREKKDTGWILELIKDDPSVVGVSIAAATYVTEDFKFEGVEGDRIDAFAWFESADYVTFPSAGGNGVMASDVTESIKKAKESYNKKPHFTSENVKNKIENLEVKILEMQSFSKFYNNEAYYAAIGAVTRALWSFLYTCSSELYWDESLNYEEVVKNIKVAFDEAYNVISTLDYLKDIQAEKDKTTESITKQKETEMKLSEFKTANPTAYVELMAEANALVTAETQEAVSAEKAKVTDLDNKIVTLTAEKNTIATELATYKANETKIKHEEVVNKLIVDSKLAKEFITDNFKSQLIAETDEVKIKEALADRVALVTAAAGKTKDTATTVIEGEQKPEEIEKAEAEKTLEKYFPKVEAK